MASFDGVTFVELYNGDELPAWSGGTRKATHAIPGSNNTLTQILGQDELTVSIRARMTAAQYASMLNKRSATGSLMFSYETTDALLDEISGVVNKANLDVYFCTLKFTRS